MFGLPPILKKRGGAIVPPLFYLPRIRGRKE
nr:MAG TPA: hypothetical protein [Caudoviricetes sp.]